MTHRDQQAKPDADRQLGLRFQWLSLLGSLIALVLAVLVLAMNVAGLLGIISLVATGAAFLTVTLLFLINLWRADRLAEHVRGLPRHRRDRRRWLILG